METVVSKRGNGHHESSTKRFINRIRDYDTMLAVDIGTTKVCAIAAVRNERNVIEILGVGMHPCSGLSATGITDLEDIATAITHASQKALDKAPAIGMPKAIAGISGTFIQSQNSTGTVMLSKHGRSVTQTDIDQCIEAVIHKSVPKDYEVIHAIPRWFRMDENQFIRDPMGMEGSALELDAHIIMGRQSILKNIRRCFNKAGITLEQFACQSVACSESVLSEEEKNTGIALIDIGGETTSVLVYFEGSIYHSEIIGIGGEDITRDLNHYFQTPYENADSMKKYHGSTLVNHFDPEETIEVVRFKNRRTIVVKKVRLCEVIEARVEQILEEVLRSLRSQNLLGFIYGGVVLTGGTALLDGIREKTQLLLKRDTHIGYPNGVVGHEDIITSPSYATAIGLLHFGFEKRDAHFALYGTGVKKVFRQFVKWAQETF